MRNLVKFFMCDLEIFRWWMVPLVLFEIVFLLVVSLPLFLLAGVFVIPLLAFGILGYGVFISVFAFNLFLYGLAQRRERHRILTQAQKDYDTQHANHR